jgi:NAD(P)-dependent dehydrogenase (short-subunit alcohol dehydrogenase family)
MSQRTALVTGATGLLGRQVYQAFSFPGSKWSVKGTGHSRADGVDILKCDLNSEEELTTLLSKVKLVTPPLRCNWD